MESKTPEFVDDYALVLGSSMPTPSIILSHLKDMKKIYEAAKILDENPLKLYVAFLYMEKEYADKNAHNYAETVHLLNPIVYQIDQKTPYLTENGSVMDRLKCPNCSIRLKPKQAYEVHMLRETIQCRNCPSTISYEALCIATFIKDYKRGRYDKLRKCRAKFQYSNEYNTWKRFTVYLNELLKHEVRKIEKDSAARQELASEWSATLKKIIKQAQYNISKFSIDLVPGMYRQLDYIEKVCENFQYWCDNEVLEESIKRYHKFMILMRYYPTKTLIPTLDIDIVWRAHETQPSTYVRYSYTIHRCVVQYNDSLQARDLEVAYAKTFIRWAKHYKEPFSSDPPKFLSWLDGHYQSSILFPPVLAYRFLTFMVHSKPLPSKGPSTSISSKPSSTIGSFIERKDNALGDIPFGIDGGELDLFTGTDVADNVSIIASERSDITELRPKSDSISDLSSVTSAIENSDYLNAKTALLDPLSHDDWATVSAELSSLNALPKSALTKSGSRQKKTLAVSIDESSPIEFMKKNERIVAVSPSNGAIRTTIRSPRSPGLESVATIESSVEGESQLSPNSEASLEFEDQLKEEVDFSSEVSTITSSDHLAEQSPRDQTTPTPPLLSQGSVKSRIISLEKVDSRKFQNASPLLNKRKSSENIRSSLSFRVSESSVPSQRPPSELKHGLNDGSRFDDASSDVPMDDRSIVSAASEESFSSHNSDF